MIPVIVTGLLLLLAVRQGEASPAPIVEAPPPIKQKMTKPPVPPRPVHPTMAARKAPEARKPIDVHTYQRDFATPPTPFKVVLTGYQIPERSPQY
jgi:hypothetical protein